MGEDKLWIQVGGRPLIAWTLDAVGRAACFDRLVVAAPQVRWPAVEALATAAELGDVRLVEGGARRQDSVAAALAECGDAEWIAVHDAARPLAPPELFRAVLSAARSGGAATAGVPCVDTVKRVEEGRVLATLDRDALIATQTPQAFAAALLVRAHDEARRRNVRGDDDAYLVELLGEPVTVVPGDPRNVKVTRPIDLTLVRALLEDAR